MFDDTDRALETWLERSGISRTARFDLPDSPTTSRTTIWCHLHRVSGDSHGGLDRRLDLAFRAHYLLVPTARDVRKAHQLLGRLAIAAAEADGMLVEADPGPAIWTGRDCPVLPGIAISVNATWCRDPAETPLVEEVAVRRAPLGDFAGVLLGPDAAPMRDEAIVLPSLKARTRTAGDGSFAFQSIPLTPGRDLLVQVRQHRWQVRPGKRPTVLTYHPVEK